ncbi:signal-induced proliferation-associated 1-like protein 1 isoform X2 [Cloeon dipterum]|uniref:signal-induced proliferation-associated 1-like protein 1 isoform X2 n=1 Tax=Cloeon dipterum TaxID=197152 RepID=UPI00321F84C8
MTSAAGNDVIYKNGSHCWRDKGNDFLAGSCCSTHVLARGGTPIRGRLEGHPSLHLPSSSLVQCELRQHAIRSQPMMGQAVAVAPSLPMGAPDLLPDEDPLIERYVADIRASSRSLMLKRNLLGGSFHRDTPSARFARSTSCVHAATKDAGRKAWEFPNNRMSSAGTVAAAPLASSAGGRPPADYYSSSMLSQHSPHREVVRNRVAAPASGTAASARGRLGGVRASYNERLASRYQPSHQHHHPPPLAAAPVRELVYRSNSSLELEPEEVSPGPLRREYGSHGSIDMLGDGPSPGQGSFFALLQDFKHKAPPDQRSPGPARIVDVLRGKVDQLQLDPVASAQSSNGGVASGLENEHDAASPKMKTKLHKFWGEKSVKKEAEQPPSIFKKLRGKAQTEDGVDGSSAVATDDEKERQRRRAFAHYDCQSLTANLPLAASRLKNLLLLRRRNTATGASAASMRSSTPDAPLSNGNSSSCEHLDEDSGDGRQNELLDSCPFFRNEIGGEEEREAGLTKIATPQRRAQQTPVPPIMHRPPLAYGISVLESTPSECLWRSAACPYQKPNRPIESTDQGALYYRKHFLGQEHQNWFGLDENLGPVAISIKREKVDDSQHSTQMDSIGSTLYQYRIIVRTSELLTLRGAILEDAIPSSKANKGASMKDLLEYVAPEIQHQCLRLGVSATATEEQLAKLDEQGLSNHYKVGVMYCRAGQGTEEEMYNNEEAGPAFSEFLETIGQRVRLRGFDKYKAGLDNKTDSTGLYSVYSQYQECEVMFHVSTLLPFTPNNRQQLLRKRHIGNDIVTVVFQEPGALPFTPKNIRSQFQHVFIVVQAISPCTESAHYKVAVSRSKDVPIFGPPLPENASFPRSKDFADFLLAKVINAENAAHRSEKFVTMATRTRQEYLKDLVANHSTSTAIETSQKFSMLSFSSKKKDKSNCTQRRSVAESFQQRGAVVWQVVLDDSGLSSKVDCLLGISFETLVLIEESSRDIIFVTPCRSILGWSASGSSLRIYYHQGECITVHVSQDSERDELMELVVRLRTVSPGCPVQEMALRRNGAGQLGFHVQPDGVVTQVEPANLAWQAGLRQGARLVEICKVAVSTLSHDQMVDLLKTSIMVTVTVIPPQVDGVTRRGCNLPNCKYTLSNYEGDYENVNGHDDMVNGKSHSKQAFQQAAANHKKRYERSLSPPRSSNSSGYGTGSSSKSFKARETRFAANPEGTMTSSSSGHSGDERDRWYEMMEVSENGDTPPPLPIRLGANGISAFHQVKAAGRPQEQTYLSSSATYPVGPVQAFPTPYVEFDAPAALEKQQDAVRGAKSRSEKAMEYLTRAPKMSDFAQPTEHLLKSTSLPPEMAVRSDIVRGMGSHSDTHSNGTSSPSDRLLGARSEDELSAGSVSNMSPRLRRGKRGEAPLTASSGSSRNQSPRTVGSTTPGGRSDNGEPRLRVNAAGRSGSNRNSASLNTSSLQEDLMRLINPDYTIDEKPSKDEAKLPGGSSGKLMPAEPSRNVSRSRSRENLVMGTPLSMLAQPEQPVGPADKAAQPSEVIFTTARPATVISNTSTASSPSPSEQKLTKEERLSPRVAKLTPPKLPLPDAREMNWHSLVDTAARAMQAEDANLLPDEPGPDGEAVADSIPEAARNGERLGHWVNDVAERLGLDTSPNSGQRRQQQQQNSSSTGLNTLENRVVLETHRRLTLEDEVRRLRDENRRLHEESQAAAQQLRRFTEWFFKTLDKH